MHIFHSQGTPAAGGAAPAGKAARIFRAGLAAALVAAAGLAGATARADRTDSATIKEYQLKAAFLFNFVQFVEWPPEAFAGPDAPVRIGVLGDDPFGPLLEQLVQGETVRGRKLTVERPKRSDDLKKFQVLFVCPSEKGQFDQILAGLRGSPVLTVSEVEGFALRGGVINFYLQGNKVRFEINPDAAQRGGLRVSAQLLSLGRIVAPGAHKERP